MLTPDSLKEKKILLLFLFVILLPYLLISFYCNPAADDFEYAASCTHHGFWTSVKRDYLNWNGRYTDNLFAFASPLVWGNMGMYKLMPVLLYSLTYSAAHFFLKTILQDRVKGVVLHILVLVFILLYVYNAPTLSESFYWYTGAITYQLAMLLSLVYLATLYKFCEEKYYKSKVIHLILLALLALFIIGLNEAILLVFLAFHFIFVVKRFALDKDRISLVVLILVILVSSAFVIFSPGNQGRESNFPERHQFFYSLYMTAQQIVRFLFTWIAQVPFVTATLLFIPLVDYLAREIPFFKNKFYVSPLITFLCLPGIIFICVFAAYWGMGLLGQHRTVNVAYFFFIPLWFMNVYNGVIYLKRKGNEMTAPIRQFQFAFLLLFLTGLVFTNNGVRVNFDLLNGRAARYNREMEARYALVKAAAGAGSNEVVVENLSAKPQALYLFDITCDPENWINKCYSDYFGVKLVRLKTCD